MKSRTYHTLSLLLIAVLFAIAIYFYFVIPYEEIPTHWNSKGEVNGYSTKTFGLFLIPVFSLGLYLLFILLPKIDPLRNNIKKFREVYNSFVLVMICFFFYIYLITLSWTLGYTFDFNLAFVPALAALFFYIGIILAKVKRNCFMGIRTPWTLNSDKVWDKTHKLGGKLFKASGIIILLGFLVPEYLVWLILVPILISVIWLIIYSYLEYRQSEK